MSVSTNGVVLYNTMVLKYNLIVVVDRVLWSKNSDYILDMMVLYQEVIYLLLITKCYIPVT
jgi:hypothetical protein